MSLGQWDKWIVDQASDDPSIIYFSKFLAKYFLKSLSIHFIIFFIKLQKFKKRSFDCPKSIRNYKRNNAWNIRHLVDDSFVPLSKRPIISYCKSADFKSGQTFQLKPGENPIGKWAKPNRPHCMRFELVWVCLGWFEPFSV